ncbi:radical SAM/SPASM domain-containing protein [Dubosiella newyorkensis]|uniref:radical SAM/SPASM domain-containing protein n=1 Tax=Dubosiella newyorkensis TaxID=1862672 RepID=UPI0026F3C4E4|nr:radical SAM protein [Dubosiella newyorkensis]
MAKVYKNLVLTEAQILFDTNTLKTFQLNKEYLNDFLNLYSGHKKEQDSKFYDLLTNNSTYAKTKNISVKIIKINMANMCNLKCKYCYANAGTYNKPKKIMSEQTIKQIIKFIHNHKELEYICFFGGEPLLNISGIKMICEKAREINPNVKFLCQTNGTLINAEFIKLLKKFEIELTLSIDGNKKDNDRNRIDVNGNGTFEKILEKTLPIQSYISSIEATYDGKSTLSKNEVKDILKEIYPNTYILVADLIENQPHEESRNIENEIQQILDNKLGEFRWTEGFLRDFMIGKRKDFFCAAGTQLITIDSDGKIYPCQQFIKKGDAYLLGDISNFNEEQFTNKVNNLSAYLAKDNYKCRNCFLNWQCHKCLAINNEINFSDCEYKKENALRIFDKLGELIVSGQYENLVKCVAGGYRYA